MDSGRGRDVRQFVTAPQAPYHLAPKNKERGGKPGDSRSSKTQPDCPVSKRAIDRPFGGKGDESATQVAMSVQRAQ
jgi:hypothetical protein